MKQKLFEFPYQSVTYIEITTKNWLSCKRVDIAFFQTLLILNGRLDVTNNHKYMKFCIIITKYLRNVMFKACSKILTINRSNMHLKKKIPLLLNRSVHGGQTLTIDHIVLESAVLQERRVESYTANHFETLFEKIRETCI